MSRRQIAAPALRTTSAAATVARQRSAAARSPPSSLAGAATFTPAKQRPEQKIDAAVALMTAVGRAMAEDTNEGDLTDFLRDPLFA